MNRKKLVVLSATAGVVLLVLGGWYFLAQRAPEAPVTGERRVLYWHDPMVPGFKSDKPGKSPFMDMELVPVYEDEAGLGGPPAVTVRPEVVQNLGVRTALVVRATPTRRLTAPGYLFRQNGVLVAIADVFGRDTTWLKPGMAAEVVVAEVFGVRFPAVLQRVESDRDIGGRSVKVHVRLRMVDARLQANMAANVVVSTLGTSRTLLVPREAVIHTGQRTALIRVLDGGRFQPVEVVAGEEFGELVEIKSGIREGEKIVVSGQFLIDSEASVRESFQRMEPVEK
jgi:multidrug efflux pump subunit AcrA (membrane-fusion protein)